MAIKHVSAKAAKVASLLMLTVCVMLLSSAAARPEARQLGSRINQNEYAVCPSYDKWADAACCSAGGLTESGKSGPVSRCQTCTSDVKPGQEWACSQCMTTHPTACKDVVSACFKNLAKSSSVGVEWALVDMCTNPTLVKSGDEASACGNCMRSDGGKNTYGCNQCLVLASMATFSSDRVCSVRSSCLECVQNPSIENSGYLCSECLKQAKPEDVVACLHALNKQ